MSTSLQPRLIKGLQAEYVPAQWTGTNTSGLRVWGKNVLIKVDDCASRTSGGIELLDGVVERMTMASTTGVICAIAPEAFTLFEDGSRWTGERPAVGDRVWFEKYAGQLQTGRDGITYRILDYRQIAATVDEDAA